MASREAGRQLGPLSPLLFFLIQGAKYIVSFLFNYLSLSYGVLAHLIHQLYVKETDHLTFC